MNTKKVIFWGLWILLLSFVPATLLLNDTIGLALTRPVALVNLIQRIFGLAAFVLVFWQILLGAYMDRLIEKLGAWIFKFHVVEGVVIYTVVLLHPIFFTIYNYFLGSGLDPFYVFTQVCVLCRNNLELYYTLGRISFWLVNITVLAGVFRAANPFMRLHWRKFHILNYLVFLLAGLHGFLVGSDFRMMPFFAFAIAAYLVVIYVLIKKIPHLLRLFGK